MLMLGCFGCSNVYPPPPHLMMATTRPADATPRPYLLQVGDVLDIKFYYNPELNERVTIRPDGRISLQLVDDVTASGISPSELDRRLTAHYERTLVKPEITVIVREFGGQQAYVGGEVARPTAMALVGGLTALQAIMKAGGFRESAHPGSVILIRKGAQNDPVSRSIDLTKVLTGESTRNDVALQPFDVVYVPKSPIANVNKFVDQYINNIVPNFLNAGFSYTMGKIKQTGEITNTVVPEP